VSFLKQNGKKISETVVVDSKIQEGQHPLTGQRAPPISGGT